MIWFSLEEALLWLLKWYNVKKFLLWLFVNLKKCVIFAPL